MLRTIVQELALLCEPIEPTKRPEEECANCPGYIAADEERLHLWVDFTRRPVHIECGNIMNATEGSTFVAT